jgi:dolichol-phosphate mannosyltransferase
VAGRVPTVKSDIFVWSAVCCRHTALQDVAFGLVVWTDSGTFSGKEVSLKDVLIAIPVFNESRTAGRVLDEVKGFGLPVVVVDDGSTDGTGDMLSSRRDVTVIRHTTNMGYGRSLIDAFEFGRSEGFSWIITMDCDEQHEPVKIPAFLDRIRHDKSDLISGTRYTTQNAGDDQAPKDRRTINLALTHVINDLFGLGLTDSFCGYKAHRVSAMNRLNLTEAGYAFPMQLWPQVALAGLKVEELSVRRIYNDPNRHFGGQLDDPERRLQHYLEVLSRELEKPTVCNGIGKVEKAKSCAVRLKAMDLWKETLERRTPGMVERMAAGGAFDKPVSGLEEVVPVMKISDNPQVAAANMEPCKPACCC